MLSLQLAIKGIAHTSEYLYAVINRYSITC